MASIVFLAGPNAGRRYKLADGDYVIGRRSDCQIFVPDMRVSRQHAKIRREDGRFWVEDLGSNNGTFVNGTKIQQPTDLRHDDEIAIANNRIRVELPDAGAPRPKTDGFDGHVTIVEVGPTSAVFRSRDESSDNHIVRSSGVLSVTDSGSHTRLLERKLAGLSAILEAAANTPDPDQLLERVVEQLLEMFPQAESVGVLVQDERTSELKVQCQRNRKKSFGGEMRVPGTIIDHVVADRRGVLLGEQTGQHAAVNAEAIGTRMGAPLQAHQVQYGVIYVESKGAAFRQEDVDLLGSVAAQAALAIHAFRVQSQLVRRQKLERDLRVARQIQRSLLPAAAPSVVGLDFAIHYEPAYQIGGDFYDFIWHDQSHLALCVGDVAGKAISAALYMARLTSELRSRAGISRTPARLLRRVNEEMVKLGDDGMFATLVYAIYDLETRTLVFTNAGHCVPLLRRGDRVFPLHADRAHVPPIGVVPDAEVGEARVQLQSGDMLILTSDGVYEARDPKGNEYGLKRLSRRIRTARGNAEDLVKAVLQDVDSHVANAPQSDDMTLLVMGIDERRAKRRTSTIPGIGPGANGRTTIPEPGTPDGPAAEGDSDRHD
ncbi:MAG: SpoIIE family protein phosphatase [Deltaproteobacteria bacterium]|nr:SpoIIE family protein phosphatase [Deltaproteobacteria bacterium]